MRIGRSLLQVRLSLVAVSERQRWAIDMKTLTAAVIVSSLALMLAGAMAATFGQKSGVVSFVILLFLISYSRRMGAAKNWGN